MAVQNHNNEDTRAGMIMQVKVNCNYIIQEYGEWKADEDGNTSYGELWHIGCYDEEDYATEKFWEDFNAVFLNELLYIPDIEERHQEIMYAFQEHIENWKISFVWVHSKQIDDLTFHYELEAKRAMKTKKKLEEAEYLQAKRKAMKKRKGKRLKLIKLEPKE